MVQPQLHHWFLKCCLTMDDSLNSVYHQGRVSDSIGPLEIKIEEGGTFDSSAKVHESVSTKHPESNLLLVFGWIWEWEFFMEEEVSIKLVLVKSRSGNVDQICLHLFDNTLDILSQCNLRPEGTIPMDHSVFPMEVYEVSLSYQSSLKETFPLCRRQKRIRWYKIVCIYVIELPLDLLEN
ncbi:GH3 family, partial [Dillenia turbinata]